MGNKLYKTNDPWIQDSKPFQAAKYRMFLQAWRFEPSVMEWTGAPRNGLTKNGNWGYNPIRYIAPFVTGRGPWIYSGCPKEPCLNGWKWCNTLFLFPWKWFGSSSKWNKHLLKCLKVVVSNSGHLMKIPWFFDNLPHRLGGYNHCHRGTISTWVKIFPMVSKYTPRAANMQGKQVHPSVSSDYSPVIVESCVNQASCRLIFVSISRPGGHWRWQS